MSTSELLDVGDGPFEPEGVYESISNERRRLVVVLVDHFGEITAGDAAGRIANVEHERDDLDREYAKVRKAVYIGLIQCHGDTLGESGVVEYDSQRNTFARTDETKAVAEYICEGYDRFGTPDVVAEVLV